MQQKELSSLLDISPAMVSRLVKKGMPTDTLERAEKWRRRHLEPSRVKGTRIDTVKEPLKASSNQAPAQPSSALLTAIGLMEHADKLLTDGFSIETLVPVLRTALAAVPEHERSTHAYLSWQVMDVLTADVFALLHENENPMKDDEHAIYSEDITDEDAAYLGDFWYRVATGEIHPA